ncbi:MAG: hypothetical protein QM736_20585 [Vicinamibacterales bacterium]
MSDYQFLVIAALLAGIVYQLWTGRQEHAARYRDACRTRERDALDAELLRWCPTLYNFARLKDLREWQAVRLRKHAYFEDRRDTLLNPFSDEPSDWSDIYFMYLRLQPQESDTDYPFPPQVTDEERPFLLESQRATEDFIVAAQAGTSLTTAEIAFITYWEWRLQFLNRDDSWSRPSSITPGLLKRAFDRALESYAVSASRRQEPPTDPNIALT